MHFGPIMETVYRFTILELDQLIQSIRYFYFSITKTGKRTLFGTVNHKMRSLMRFYTQFTDVNKHDAINKFLGNKTANFNNVHMSKLNLEVKDHN